jgi:minor extracellular serine protease Vpr
MRGQRYRTRVHIGMIGALAVLFASFGASPAGSAVNVETERFAGADRYATAALAALDSFPGGSNNIIVASGENFPDGLAAAYLSGAANAPVLLTARDSLPAATANAIGTLDGLVAGDATVHIVGGPAAVSAAVRSQLTALGYDLNQIGGANRYQTAANVAVAANGIAGIGNFDGKRTAIVTTGENFPDALSAGSLAQAGRHPVLLTTSAALSPETDLTLGALNIEQVIILGGTSAVSAGVAAAIEAKGIDVVRVSGSNRYGTAAELAELLTTPVVSGGAGWDAVDFVLALGTNFPDALAASQVGGVHQAPILLTTSPLPTDTRNLLQLRANTVAKLFVMGGNSAISPTTLQQAVTAATVAAPTATVVGLAGNQSFTVQFSEPVQNADVLTNYRLNNAALPGGSTIVDGPAANQVTVNLGGGTELELNDVITVNPAGGTIQNPGGIAAALTSFTVVANAPAP